MTDTWSVTGATREQRQAIADSLDDTRSWVDPRGYRLSDRLWLGRDADRKAIDKVLRQCLAAGLNPLETERVLTKYLTPGGMAGGIGQATTRDGQSRYPVGSRFDQDTQQWVDNLSRRGNYAARRLARTEQARAYGAATLEAAARNPWTAGVQWNLTGRHAEEDECDENAQANPDGLGRGVYKVENFPRFPNHPNCLCYVTKVAKPLDDVLAIAREELAGGGGAVVAQPAVGPSWIDRIRELQAKDKADLTLDEVKEAGRLVREQVTAGIDSDLDAALREYGTLKSMDPAAMDLAAFAKWRTDLELAKLRASAPDRIDAYHEAKRDLQNAYNLHDPNNRRKARIAAEKIKAAEERLASITEGTDVTSSAALGVLKQARSFGTDQSHTWVNDGSVKSAAAAISAFDAVAANFPTDWVETSVKASPMLGKSVKRGYYSNSGDSGYSEFSVSGNTDAAKIGAAAHEFGHRVEHTYPGLAAMERAFYDSRTFGEPSQHMGKGYDKSERTKPDNFYDRYVGKDYGRDAFEVLTMGIEDICGNMKPPYWLLTDPDYADFVLGMLAVV